MSGPRLLIVDDEPLLRTLLRRYMERAGYQVDTCGTAGEALDLFEADPDRFAVVIADLTLEGASGEELVGKMRDKNPRIGALIASGYPYQPTLRGVGFLQKPFLPQMLEEAVETILKKKS